MSDQIRFISPSVYTATWIPVGKSNMESLNRFVGAHKKYSEATEFGARGSVNNIASGKFKLQGHGIFMVPVDYDFTGFLHANIRETYDSDKEYGFSIYKNGLCVLGLKSRENPDIDNIKILTGKLTYKFADLVFPTLNDVQQNMISGFYDTADIMQAHHKIRSYSIIQSEAIEGLEIESSGAFLKEHPGKIDALTDWIISHTSINNCHLFIGMAAAVCIGDIKNIPEDLLRHLLYVQSCLQTSLRLHTYMWSIRKRANLLRSKIPTASYKILKKYTEDVCMINDHLSKLNIFDELIRTETEEMKEKWENIDLQGYTEFTTQISKRYADEVEKSLNRESMVLQLKDELEAVNSSLENRLDIIMTSNSMWLNIVLFALTIISVLTIGEVTVFTPSQWFVVAVILVPFSALLIYFLFLYSRHFWQK